MSHRRDMTMKLAQHIPVLASFLLLACAMPRPVTVFLATDDVHASAKLVKISTNASTQARFVYAKLSLDGNGKKLESVNLNCFALTINGVESTEINVDSVASVLTDPYPAGDDSRIQVPVYWVFSAGKALDERKISAAKMGIKSDMGSCFHY